MKNLIFIGLFFFSFIQCIGQNWFVDLGEAKEVATQKNVPIVLVFQGSDWCAPCIKLEREIWSSEEFINYSKEHYVLLKADFPKKKGNALSAEQQAKNNALAEKYNQQGYFPLVVILDHNGKVLGSIGYKKNSPKEYIERLNSFL